MVTNIQPQPTVINPQTAFNIPYSEILSNIQDGTLTYTENKILLVLSQCEDFTGVFYYPKQVTFAEKAGLTPRQLSNVLKSLEKKGFILRKSPTLTQRRLYRHTTQYYFLDHPIYAEAEKGLLPPKFWGKIFEK